MPKKKQSRRSIPPCPDPLRYEWVNSKEGGYWRLKKGADGKPVKVNAVLTRYAELTGETNKAAKQVMDKLKDFLRYMVLGRAVVRMAGAFKKACFSSDTMDYGFLLDYEFQKDQPFEKLCSGQVQKKVKAGQLDVVVPTGNLHVKKLAKGVVGYHFVAVLLYGNPAKKSTLRTEVEESKVYGFDKTEDTPWRFSFVLPNKQQPWMVMLGITCDVKLGTPSPAYCRMKVIAVSR